MDKEDVGYICCCLVTQSYQMFCSPMDHSPPAFTVHGIFQAKILEWVGISFSRGSSRPRDLLHCRWILYCWGTKEACGIYIHVRLFATSWTVAHKAPLSMGFPRVAIFYSRGPSWPRDQTHVSCVSWIAGSFFTCRAYKKNEFLPFATIRMDLESVMLSEINQWKILCYQSCVESKIELRECIWQKRNRLIESKLVLISGEKGRGRNKIGGKMHRDKLLCEK